MFSLYELRLPLHTLLHSIRSRPCLSPFHSSFVHSLMSYVHLICSLPLFRLPSIMPLKIALMGKVLRLGLCPKHFSYVRGGQPPARGPDPGHEGLASGPPPCSAITLQSGPRNPSQKCRFHERNYASRKCSFYALSTPSSALTRFHTLLKCV